MAALTEATAIVAGEHAGDADAAVEPPQHVETRTARMSWGDASTAAKALVTLAALCSFAAFRNISGAAEAGAPLGARSLTSNCTNAPPLQNCSAAAPGPRPLVLGNCTADVALAFVQAPSTLRGGGGAGGVVSVGSVQLAGLLGLCVRPAASGDGTVTLEPCDAVAVDGEQDGAGPLVHGASGACLRQALGDEAASGSSGGGRIRVSLAPCAGGRDQRWAQRDDGRLQTAFGDGFDCGRCALAGSGCLGQVL